MGPQEFVIDTRKLRYSGIAMNALKKSGIEDNLRTHDQCEDNKPVDPDNDNLGRHPSPRRVWLNNDTMSDFLTTGFSGKVALWVEKALRNYRPTTESLDFVRPYALKLHTEFEKERDMSTRLHELDTLVLTYQCALEVCGAVLLAANTAENPIDYEEKLRAQRVGGDDHFASWGRLLTGLECDPPMIAQVAFYLLMCQSFTFEPTSPKEDYIYSTLISVDWAKSHNELHSRLAAFEARARAAVPTLDDAKSGRDRCVWRASAAYVKNLNACENERDFKTPKDAYIEHGLDLDLVIIGRAFCGERGRRGYTHGTHSRWRCI